MDAVRIVEDEVRELIRRRGIDPSSQGSEVRRLVEAAVNDYDERSLLGALPPLGQLERARRHVYDAVAGFGALQPLLDDPRSRRFGSTRRRKSMSPEAGNRNSLP